MYTTRPSTIVVCTRTPSSKMTISALSPGLSIPRSCSIPWIRAGIIDAILTCNNCSVGVDETGMGRRFDLTFLSDSPYRITLNVHRSLVDQAYRRHNSSVMYQQGRLRLSHGYITFDTKLTYLGAFVFDI